MNKPSWAGWVLVVAVGVALWPLQVWAASSALGCDSAQTKTILTPSGGFGAIFAIEAFACTPVQQASSQMTFTAVNQSRKWVSLSVKVRDGQDFYDSGRFDPGQTNVRAIPFGPRLGRLIHITRWAPGFLEFPGNGGGEAFLQLPTVDSEVYINVRIKD